MYVESNTPNSGFSYWAYKNHFLVAEYYVYDCCCCVTVTLHFCACIYHGVHIVEQVRGSSLYLVGVSPINNALHKLTTIVLYVLQKSMSLCLF
ncbi:hypothetical protein AMTRI_Chr06g177020 [Amborella trichopoda]